MSVCALPSGVSQTIWLSRQRKCGSTYSWTAQ